MSDAFWEGLWSGIFQLIGLGLVAFWVNFVWQRFRVRAAMRQELVDEIDDFAQRLYKPRKVYQRAIESEGDAHARERIHRSLEEILEATGRLRSLQVKLVPLFGYHVELFAHYLAVWRYLKEIRDRMEHEKSLYFENEGPDSADALYRLMDAFRYRIHVERVMPQPPGAAPPPDVLGRIQERSRAIFSEYFGASSPE